MSAAEDITAHITTPWLTYEGAAEYVSLSVKTLHSLVSARQIPVYGSRRRRRFRKDMLDMWLTNSALAMRKWAEERRQTW